VREVRGTALYRTTGMLRRSIRSTAGRPIRWWSKTPAVVDRW